MNSCKKRGRGMDDALSKLRSSIPVNGELTECGWYVAYTQPQKEQLARINLENQGFEAYLCQCKTFKKSHVGLLEAWHPMFPRYIFFRPRCAEQSISVARSTRGISFVLSFGLVPALLKTEEMEMIQALERAQNQLNAEDTSPFQPGLKVRLQHCGLSGLEGLVYSVSKERVTLLIKLLGREKRLVLEHHQLELVTP